jgi:hypothetical protein
MAGLRSVRLFRPDINSDGDWRRWPRRGYGGAIDVAVVIKSTRKEK